MSAFAFAEDNVTSSESESEQENSIPHLYTFIDSAVVEQRQVFNAEEIQASHTENLVDFFQGAGMQILSYGPYGLEAKPSIRGFTDETVRVVIDGICVNNPQYGTFDFTSINLNDIERIEIVRGGFTEGVSDEGSVGGTIYITTKKQLLGTEVFSDSSIKSYFNSNVPVDTYSQSLGFSKQISENDFLKINGKFASAENKFQFKAYNGKTKTRENSGVTDGSGDIKYSHFFGNGYSLSAGESFYGGKKHCPGTENSGNPGVQKDYDNRLNFSADFPELKKGFSLQGNGAWLSNLRYYDDLTGSSRHFVNTGTVAVYGDFHQFSQFNQTAGVTMSYVNLDSTDDGFHQQFSGTLKETSRYSFNSVFSVSVPLALRWCGENVEFVPKLGFKAATKYVDVILNGYRMIQFPNMDDLYWDAAGYHGNPDLKAEDGWGAELNLNLHDFYVPLSLGFYTNYYENKIQWSNTSGTWQPENVASAFYAGANFYSEKELFNRILVLKASGEYLYTALLDESNSQTYKKRIMWTPDWIFSGSVTVNTKPVSITVEENYTGKRYKSNLNITYMEPYSLVNCTLQLNLWKHAVPYLRIENLLDTDYESVDDYPMPGISITAGARLSW